MFPFCKECKLSAVCLAKAGEVTLSRCSTCHTFEVLRMISTVYPLKDDHIAYCYMPPKCLESEPALSTNHCGACLGEEKVM